MTTLHVDRYVRSYKWSHAANRHDATALSEVLFRDPAEIYTVFQKHVTTFLMIT